MNEKIPPELVMPENERVNEYDIKNLRLMQIE